MMKKGKQQVVRKYIDKVMNAGSFVEKLAKLSPSKDKFTNPDFSEEYMNSIMREFFVKKKNFVTFEDKGDAIFDLVNNYDLSNVEIGLVTFNDHIIKKKYFSYFGKLEGVDDIVVCKSNNNILVLEGNSEHILWSCAKNSESFLDALIICADFLLRCIFEEDLWTDNDEISKYSKLASNAAGGEAYINFYLMLLGYS